MERAKESLSTTFAWFKPFFGSFVPSLIHFLRFPLSGGASGITGIREKEQIKSRKMGNKEIFQLFFGTISLCLTRRGRVHFAHFSFFSLPVFPGSSQSSDFSMEIMELSPSSAQRTKHNLLGFLGFFLLLERHNFFWEAPDIFRDKSLKKQKAWESLGNTPPKKSRDFAADHSNIFFPPSS